MERIVVIGGGGHAKVLVAVLKKLGWDIAGYTDPRDRGAILGVPYLGTDEALRRLARARRRLAVAIGVGKVDASATRVMLWNSISSLGPELPVIVSSRAAISEEVDLGPGTVVFDGAVVGPGTVAGRLCIMNSNSTVEHDCRLGENVHVAPGATVSGNVTIGANSMIGAGSTVSHGLTICAGCMIGAGSTVLRDIATPGTYAGVPARRIGEDA